MIAYIYCKCTKKNRELTKKFKESGYEVRHTKYNSNYSKEAKEYGLKLPFVVENGEAREI